MMRRKILSLAAVALLYLFTCIGHSSIAHGQFDIWFGDSNTGVAGGATPDFLSKFDEPSSWATSNANMSTYMFLRPTLTNLGLSDSWYTDTLLPQLNSGNTKFGLNVTGATWLSITSGAAMDLEMAYLENLQNLGIEVESLSLQSVLSKAPPNGEFYPISQRIADVVTYAVAAREIYPDVKIGIIDALYAQGDDYTAPYSNLDSALAISGIQLDHVIVDLPYHYIRDGVNGVTWNGVQELASFIQESDQIGAEFGLTLTHATSGGSNSNLTYHQGVMDMLAGMIEAQVEPDFVNVMAWFPYPTHSLPENPRVTNFGHLGTLNAVAEVSSSTTAPICIGQMAKTLPSDGGSMNDFFGHSVSTNESECIIGVVFDDDNAVDAGSAYLFSNSSGQQTHKLLATDGAANDEFGYSVAINESFACVSARSDDDNGTDSGAVYLFDRESGQQIDKLVPDDGAVGDLFGHCVAIDGMRVVIGARHDDDNGSNSGSAYLFDLVTGEQLFKFLPDDGDAADLFGSSVAISGNYVLIGSIFDDDNGSNSGSAYVFDAITGQQLAKLLPSDGGADDEFGYSVAICDDYAIVGVPFDDDNGEDSGSVYVFDLHSSQQLSKILPSDGAEGDYFGFSIGIDGTTAIIGAPFDDDLGTNSGSAYGFSLATGQPTNKILASDGAAGDTFGRSVAVKGTKAIAGSRKDDDNGFDSGSAYLFDVDDCVILGDVNLDGVLSLLDVGPFVELLTTSGYQDEADINQDGVLNLLDVNPFVDLLSGG